MSKTKRVVLGLLFVVACFGLNGCPADSPLDPDGGNGQDGGLDTCEVDNSQRRSTDPDWELTAGGEASLGYVCPQGDVDHYWFQVDQARSILLVSLNNNVSMSPVDYCYDLFFEGQDARLGSNCDYEGMDGETHLSGSHYLENAGRYYLEVRDANQDESDPRNPYLVSFQTTVDPDQYEPNNTADQAKDLAQQKGYVSFLDDQDWYQVTGVQAGQVMLIDLTTEAASEVDLRYTLFLPDKTTPVNQGQDANGLDQATSLHDVLPLNQSGTYYLQVTDVNNDDSELDVGYTLQVSLLDNLDPQDASPPFNNSWENAESITSGQLVDGRYIFTRGDEDWYKITSPGVTDTDPALLEIDLQANGNQLDPVVELIVADPHHDCSPGDPCDLLEIACAQGCDTVECSNARCPSHECFIQMNQCRGAGMCLERSSGGHGCGIGSLLMHGVNWSETGDPRHLHTMAPMFGDTYYIRVGDFQSDDYDLQNSYSLRVTVHTELDQHEPNAMYHPDLTDSQEEDTRNWNKSMAVSVDCVETVDEISCGPIQGWLSFRGDQDWYRLSVTGQSYFLPELDEVDPVSMGPKVDWDVVFEWSYQGNPMQIGYVLLSGQQRMGPELGVGQGTWGTGAEECSYFCGEYHLPSDNAYLWVFTPDFRGYDHLQPYNITIRATKSCPANCDYCAADCSAWCCPNPNLPDPPVP